jgi:hypothetical protein
LQSKVGRARPGKRRFAGGREGAKGYAGRGCQGAARGGGERQGAISPRTPQQVLPRGSGRGLESGLGQQRWLQA